MYYRTTERHTDTFAATNSRSANQHEGVFVDITPGTHVMLLESVKRAAPFRHASGDM